MKGDMTEGSTTKVLVLFSIPIVIGNILQQLYNTTDAIIVGRLVGKNALAAVGVSNPIMSIAIFFIFGICIGMSVLMAQFFGSENYKTLKREVSTALITGIMFTLVISIICIFLSHWVLVITGTPKEILHDADIYLKIIFGGLIFSFLYNFYSSSLRAIGDSKTPLIFLFISCGINAMLCLLLIGIFKLGVAGSAIATVSAQGIASILCIVYVYTKIPMLKLRRKDIIIDKALLRKTIDYSWVTAVQQTCLFVGKLLVQGVVNPFGANAIAAYNSVTRVDSLVLSPADSFGTAIATYSAQNKGAGKYSRINEGFKKSNIVITIYCVIIALIVHFGAGSIMKLFVPASEKGVIGIGVEYLKLMSWFYVMPGFCNIFQGLFRGTGKLQITFIATFIQIFVRVAMSYILAPYFGVPSVCYAMAAGWVLMIGYEGICSLKYFNEVKTIKAKIAAVS